MSTLEAVARAVELLEGDSGPEIARALLRPLLHMTQHQSSIASRVVHRPERRGYRPDLLQEVTAAAKALLRVDIDDHGPSLQPGGESSVHIER